MFNRILVPLDGSELAERGLEPAFRLARRAQGQVLLLRVPAAETMLVPHGWPTGYGLVLPDQALERSRQEAREYLLTVAQRAPRQILIRPMLARRTEDVAEAIVCAAAEEKADLIAMSSHGRSGFTRWMLGSIAERVLQTAPCPVLVIRGSEGIRSMLIPLDGSPLSEQALGPGLALAAALGSNVVLLRAVPAIDVREIAALDEIERGFSRRYREEIHLAAESYLRGLIQAGRPDGLQISMVVTNEPAAKSIVKYAETYDVDLIAMATHGRSGVRRWIYGSVTEKVLHAGRYSMLIVRPPAQGGPAPVESDEQQAADSIGPLVLEAGEPPASDPHAAQPTARPAEAAEAALEKFYLEAYLSEHNHTLQTLQQLPEDEARRLMAAASAYASAKLAEVETRARLVQELERLPPP